jgi:teichuronic acid biosynthesis glycosyltransferase TuaC
VSNNKTRLKVVTFTTLYPNSIFPRHGIFVEERLKHLLESGQVDVTVIAPIPWFPLKSGLFGEYGKLGRVPRTEERLGLIVHYPRYLAIPKFGMTIAPLLLSLSLIRRFRNLKKELGDKFIIDAHYLYPDGVAACLLGMWLDLPVVMTARGNDVTVFPKYIGPKAMILWAARFCQKLITVSESLKTHLADLGVSREKLLTLRNGVDLEKFKPASPRAQNSKFSSRGLKLLSVGHLIDRKGHDLTIEAVAKIQMATLTIIGEGPLQSKLQHLVNQLGIDDRVSIIGVVSQAELVNYYNSADILVLPSKREGMPNVVLESLACGTPVIAARAEGVEELLTCPAAGIVLDERSPDHIVAAIEYMSSNYPDPADTRAYAETLGWAPTIDGILEVFREVP